MKKPSPVHLISGFRAFRNKVGNLSKLTTAAPRPLSLVGLPHLKVKQLVTLTSPQPPPPPSQPQPDSSSSRAKIPWSYDNPCLDLYFHVVPANSWGSRQDPLSHKYLKQLLPLAWSHNPLTTLKLICNLLDDRNTTGKELFYTAAFWLQQNHPKTLAHNILPISVLYEDLTVLPKILYGILVGPDAERRRNRMINRPCKNEDFLQKKVGGSRSRSSRREEITAMTKKAVERYQRDPDYQFLHSRVSVLFAECLKSDVQKVEKYKQQKSKSDNVKEHEQLLGLEISTAASCCPFVDSFFDRTTLLCESIARNLFPTRGMREGVEEQEEEEEDYAFRVRDCLMKEVLKPLRKFTEEVEEGGYAIQAGKKPCEVKEYLENVKAGKTKIVASAFLPHEIIGYLNDHDFKQLAEPQWKAMVGEIYLKQGKLRNCLAVCDVSGRMCGHPMDVSLAFGLLVSELSEEPWKGKVFTFGRKPKLHLIQGDDLESKCAFTRRMDGQDWDGETDFQKLFDLILEVAVNQKLTPEQMIKKVFVFTSDQDSDDASANSWETDYEAIKSKFEEKGYRDVVPQIVFWDLNDDRTTPVARSTQQGVAMLGGFSKNLVKLFLDDDGEIDPNHVMELAIGGKEYERLAVVD